MTPPDFTGILPANVHSGVSKSFNRIPCEKVLSSVYALVTYEYSSLDGPFQDLTFLENALQKLNEPETVKDQDHIIKIHPKKNTPTK
jgi:hypothetical protein